MENLGTGALVRHLRAIGILVTERQLDHHIRAGHLPEPARTTSGHRAWDPANVARVETFFRDRQRAASHGE